MLDMYFLCSMLTCKSAQYNVQTSKYVFQSIMYSIICTRNRLHTIDTNKDPAFPGCIWSNWHNVVVQPPRTQSHGKCDSNGKGWYLQVDDDNKMSYKYNLSHYICTSCQRNLKMVLKFWRSDNMISKILLFSGMYVVIAMAVVYEIHVHVLCYRSAPTPGSLTELGCTLSLLLVIYHIWSGISPYHLQMHAQTCKSLTIFALYFIRYS